MKRVFVVSLHNTGVAREHHIVGFLSSNDKNMIANYIKNQYGLILQDLLPNRFSFEEGYHQEYNTDNSQTNVHVDICFNLNPYEDE